MKVSLIVLLLALVSASEFDVFERLSQDDFGREILQTIQLEMSGPVDTVENTLQGLLEAAQQENNSIRQNLSKRQQTCTDQQQDASNVIQRATNKKADDERKVPLKQEELLNRQSSAEDKNSEEERNNDKLQIITSDRQDEKNEYEERRDELVGLIATLEQAKNIIATLDNSFLQKTLAEHFDAFHENFPKKSAFKSLVQVLLNTKSQDKVKILDIIQEMIESLYEIQKEELLVDDSREQAYQKQKASLLLGNQYLAASIATLNAAVLQTKQDLLELHNDINSQKQLIAVKNKELQDWIKTCNDEEQGLRAVYDNRTGQIELLNQVILIFQKGLSADLRKSIAQIQVR